LKEVTLNSKIFSIPCPKPTEHSGLSGVQPPGGVMEGCGGSQGWGSWRSSWELGCSSISLQAGSWLPLPSHFFTAFNAYQWWAQWN